MAEEKKRSLVKSMTWRIFSSLVTGGIIYLLTDNLTAASIMTLLDLGVMVILYFIHERIWDRIEYGRRTETED